jgi:hypothetical protein
MDPHQNEYLGAVAGMAETYGTAPPAIGTDICFRHGDWPAGTWDRGRVIDTIGEKLIVDIGDDLKVISVEDVLPF